jgi:hypothetical protein
MTVDITPKAPPMSLPKCLFSPLSGHVRERPVAIVMEQRAVKLQIGFLEGGNRRAVHQVNVKVSVVEDSSSAWASCVSRTGRGLAASILELDCADDRDGKRGQKRCGGKPKSGHPASLIYRGQSAVTVELRRYPG